MAKGLLSQITKELNYSFIEFIQGPDQKTINNTGVYNTNSGKIFIKDNDFEKVYKFKFNKIRRNFFFHIYRIYTVYIYIVYIFIIYINSIYFL